MQPQPSFTTSPYQAGQATVYVVVQPVIVQPPPQAMQDATMAQPGAFQAALMHGPVQTALLQQGAGVVKAPQGEEMNEPGAVQIHSPRKADNQQPSSIPAAKPGGAQGSSGTASTVPGPEVQSLALAQTRPQGTTPNGCCDDVTFCCIVWDDGGSCARLIDSCCGVTLRGCAALTRGIGSAISDCLPSSQAIHAGCDSLASAATQCCKGFGSCLEGGLGLCKDIITCPCTACGQICNACCEGLGQLDCSCCKDCECCCCCCDGNGCDCSGCDCNC